ncbi:hypothetical protein PHSY_006613 [Pseudozyma hubeiensis SY62]|uniref:TAFII55 protein conserved region domain-containing protein n=1 Tax=Pseudozyma hubeiensis (strain SY62) TaxID=1305764 RepID=R9PCB5_PSEHS|nr:hypothetical protein PHSY_006613 [Pseudozyma hubeiensis SY62]GAC99016.1 hypothetical protein PHSY_006613 [Pseudozyma hubeiensis SY62]
MSEASGSASPAPGASAAELGPGGTRPKRAVRPTAKALLAREQSPEGWEHGGSRRSQPSRPIRTSSGARPQIKLKMKASGGGTAAGTGQGPKTHAYMQSYDRELDSEDDETGQGLAFEEQLIFRMPEGPECDKLRESIQKRQLGDDVWFKFKDSRRAVVHAGDSLFSAKLVDLPTITEAHKTLDNRQFFKVADIAQMLVVEGKIADEAQASSSSGGKGFNIEDFIYPHGITPPMQWARKRRFRKRAARRAIETTEKEVERLLKADKKAEQVEYEMIDAAEEDGSEDDDDDQRRGQGRRGATSPGGSQAETPMPDGSDVGSQDEGLDDGDAEDGEQGYRRRVDLDEDGVERGYDDQDLDDDDVDEDLAAELDAALEEEEDDDDDGSTRGANSEAQSRASDQEDLWDDDDDDDADEADEEDEDEEDENDEEKEQRVREAQLEAECRELETLVRRKQADVDGTMNLIIKNRHQQALRKLTTERDMKRNQLSDLKQARKERKEADQAASAAAAAQAGQATADSPNADEPAQPRSADDYSMHPPSQPQSGPNAEPALGATAAVVNGDAKLTSQNRGMPPPALPASRNTVQPTTLASQLTEAGPGDSDLWDDDEEEDEDE